MRLRWWQIGLLLCLLIALASPLASSAPDGLERVAEDGGFLERAGEPLFQVIPDYLFPGIKNETVATILAALIGTLAVFGMMCGTAWLMKLGRRNRA